MTGGSRESCRRVGSYISFASLADLARIFALRERTYTLRLSDLRLWFPPPLNVDDDRMPGLLVVQPAVRVRARDAVNFGRAGAVEAGEADVDAGREVVRVEALRAFCAAKRVNSCSQVTRALYVAF